MHTTDDPPVGSVLFEFLRDPKAAHALETRTHSKSLSRESNKARRPGLELVVICHFVTENERFQILDSLDDVSRAEGVPETGTTSS